MGFLNNKGFSITGTLVALGIGTVLMSGLTQQQINSAKQSKTLGKKIFIDGTISYMQGRLKDFCTETFKVSGPSTSKKYAFTLKTSNDSHAIEKDTIKLKTGSGTTDFVLRNKFKTEEFTGENIHLEKINLVFPINKIAKTSSLKTEHIASLQLVFKEEGRPAGSDEIKKIISPLTYTYKYDISGTGTKTLNNFNTKFELKSCDSLGVVASPPAPTDVPCLTLDPAKSVAGCGAGHNTSGAGNVFVGGAAGRVTSSGGFNTFIGAQAGDSNRTGKQSVFVGWQAGYRNTTGDYNNFIGYQAGGHNSGGRYNTFIGWQSGFLSTSGNDNTFLGTRAGYANKTGHSNTFLGHRAGESNDTGYYNTFVGWQSGFYNKKYNNTFVGFYSGFRNNNGKNNTFLGAASGSGNTTGESSTFVGRDAGRDNTTGSRNTFIGDQAGRDNTTGANNICIGEEACSATEDRDGRIAIGNNIEADEGTINIGNVYKSETGTPRRTSDYRRTHFQYVKLCSYRYVPSLGANDENECLILTPAKIQKLNDILNRP